MATVIDKFLVALGLDVTEYVQGQKKAEESLQKFGDKQSKQSKEIALQAKAMAEGFRIVRNELMSLVAIAFGATSVKDFLNGMVNGQAALGRVSKNLGESAREIDAWGAAVETVGGTTDGFQRSMLALNTAVMAFNRGDFNNEAVAAFSAIGVNIATAEGKVRPLKDLLTEIARAFEKRTPQEQLTLGRMMGFDDGTIALLQTGEKQVRATYEEMYRASRVSDESVKKAQEAQKAWAELRKEMAGLGQTIFSLAVPGIVSSTKALNDQIRAISEWADKYKSLRDMWENVKAGKAGAKPGEDAKKSIWTWLLTPLKGTENGLGRPSGGGAGGGRGFVNPPAAGEKTVGQMFSEFESQHGLPPGFLSKVRQVESGGNDRAVSKAGAMGPFQFMPATAAQYGLKGDDVFDPLKSGAAAARYISELAKRYSGDLIKAMAGYNWGPTNLDSKGMDKAPSETIGYIRRLQGMGAFPGKAANTTNVSTSIQTVNIQTRATDAAGIARSIQSELQDQSTLWSSTLALQ